VKARIIISAFLFMAFACKKNNTGGGAEIVAFPQYNGKDVFGAIAYVKFGTTSAPSDPIGSANLKIIGETGEKHIHIENLRYGKYYVYTVGYDSASRQTVKGGLGVQIKWKERWKEVDVNIPVTP
jgi:hypothetical protein